MVPNPFHILSLKSTYIQDRFWRFLFSILAFSALALLVCMVWFLLVESLPFLVAVWADAQWLNVFTLEGWYPEEGFYSLAPIVLGSVLVTLGSLLLALPVGLGCAIFIHFYVAPSLRRLFLLLLSVLGSIPSVVFGLWGLTRVVPQITAFQPPGTSLLAAILVLAFMIVPTLALTAASALEGVQKNLMIGALALGLKRSSRIVHIALPAAKAGIFGGVLLALGRALGETMAILMVAGNVVQLPSSVFDPVRTLTTNIALEMSYAMDAHRSSLFFSGLLLTALVAVIAVTLHRSVGYSSLGRPHG